MDYIAIALALAGVIGFYRAGEWEARDGSPNRGVLWATLSLLVSVLTLFVAGAGWVLWLCAQAGLFFAIGAVRALLDQRG